MKITERMTIAEILERYPETKRVFSKRKMGCLTCMGAASESLEAGAVSHGLDPKEIVSELNLLIGGKKG